MRLKSCYLEDFIKLVQEEYGEELEINENTGKYWNKNIPIMINSWNNKIELKRVQIYSNINKTLKIFIKTNEHWYEEDPEGSEE